MRKIIKIMKPIANKVPGLAAYYRNRRDKSALSHPVEYREALGFKFNGPVAMEKGLFEPHETELIVKILGDVSNFINIGANAGYYCLHALKAGCSVIAVEPNQLNATVLLNNVQANGWGDKLELFPVALSHKIGILPIYGSGTGASLIPGWAGQTDSTLVPINTMDTLLAKREFDGKTLVLIDVEGAEYDCLKGGLSILAEQDNFIFFVEITVSEHQQKGITKNPNFFETFKLFDDLGYSAYLAKSDTRKIPLKEIEAIQNNRGNTLDTHNFIFTRNEDAIRSLLKENDHKA